MLKEFIEGIVALAPTSSRAICHQPGGMHRKMVIDQGGKHTFVVLDPPLRSPAVTTLADLIEFAKRPNVATNPVVWHDRELITLVLDDDDRLEQVTLKLFYAPTFSALQELACGTGSDCLFNPKDLANFVKLSLAGCNIPPELIQSLRKLKWEQRQRTNTEFGPNRESIGRDVEAELTATVNLPEYVIVSTPVYGNVGEGQSYTVNCVVDPRPMEQKIAFLPVPGEIDDMINLAQASIRERLVKGLPEGTPVFAGTP